MDVLLVGDVSGVHVSLHYGLSKVGAQSKLLLLGKSSNNPTTSDQNVELLFPPKLLRPFSYMFKLVTMPRYDVISFAHRISFLPRSVPFKYVDVPLLRTKCDVLSYTGLGCDEISLPKVADLYSYKLCDGCEKGDSKFCESETQPLHRKARKIFERNFKAVIASTPEYSHIGRFSNETNIIPFPCRRDIIPWHPSNFRSRKVRILHAPTARYRKGSDVVESALQLVREKGIDFEYREINGLSWSDYLRALKECDIVIDQVWSQSLGMNALWCMAMGKVVFSGNEPEAYAAAPWTRDNPAINASPDPFLLASKLEHVLVNWPSYRDLPEKGLEYVGTVHDPEAVAKQYLGLWSRKLSQ